MSNQIESGFDDPQPPASEWRRLSLRETIEENDQCTELPGLDGWAFVNTSIGRTPADYPDLVFRTSRPKPAPRGPVQIPTIGEQIGFPIPPQSTPPPATDREMFLAFEWLREMGLRATDEGKALERRCFAIMSELNRGLVIRLAAQDLMTFLRENTGSNDDWPVEIMTDNADDANLLAERFTALEAALKADQPKEAQS